MFPEHSEAKSGRMLQSKSVPKPKSNPILIEKTQSPSDHNIVKLWKNKNSKDTYGEKGQQNQIISSWIYLCKTSD